MPPLPGKKILNRPVKLGKPNAISAGIGWGVYSECVTLLMGQKAAQRLGTMKMSDRDPWGQTSLK